MLESSIVKNKKQCWSYQESSKCNCTESQLTRIKSSWLTLIRGRLMYNYLTTNKLFKNFKL